MSGDSLMQGLGEGLIVGSVFSRAGAAGVRANQIEVLTKQIEDAENRAAANERRANKAELEAETLRKRVAVLEKQLRDQQMAGSVAGYVDTSAYDRLHKRIDDAMEETVQAKDQLHIKEQEFMEFFAMNGGMKKVFRKETDSGLRNQEETQNAIDESILEFAEEQGGKLNETNVVKSAKERIRKRNQIK